VSEEVNTECSIGTQFYNFHFPSLTLSTQKLPAYHSYGSCASKQTGIKNRHLCESVNESVWSALSRQQLGHCLISQSYWNKTQIICWTLSWWVQFMYS